MKKLSLAGFAVAVGLTVGAPAQANLNVLWYNGVSDGYATAENALATPGVGDPSSAAWSITHWYDGSSAPSGSFNVLVIGSASSGGSGSL
ncbi:MAG: hypothetical protein H7251_14610, partial [Acetobacteraceae bacterium]|nr:hypothetical protein [Acetobacteraceae bacterium]